MVKLAGAWSASPTPLTNSMKVDTVAVKRLTNHHVSVGVKGVFIAGTCGEGPWLVRKEVRKLTEKTVEAANGRIAVAVQVTDNSYSKVLEHIADAKSDGADIAVVAEPWFGGGFIKDVVLEKYYSEILKKSPLPIGLYTRGGLAPKFCKQALKHRKVCMLKDSAGSAELIKIGIAAKKQRKSLTLLTGMEIGLVPYFKAGYDGGLAGGGAIIAPLITKMCKAGKSKDFKELARLQEHINRILFPAYGGKTIKSWLTGYKYTLLKMGIFRTLASYIEYPLPAPQKKAIDSMVKREEKVLFNL